MALALRQGIGLQGAIEQLRGVSMSMGNIANGASSSDVARQRDEFVSAVETTESQLQNIFEDPAAWNRLYSTTYWAIRDVNAASSRPAPLIMGEAKEIVRYLDALRARLMRLEERRTAALGKITVVDTNVLLHFQPPSQIDWRKVVGDQLVRLVLPLRVIEELDEIKYRDREVADRARRLLREMWELLGPTKGAPTRLREGVTVELPIDDEPRNRTLDADEEVLAECTLLRAIGSPVTLVTDDTGMSLRAVARSIDVVRLPEAYLRRRPQPDDAPSE